MQRLRAIFRIFCARNLIGNCHCYERNKTMKKIGTDLVEFRKTYGLEREGLAEILGVPHQTILDWESNKAEVSEEQYQQIVDMLHTKREHETIYKPAGWGLLIIIAFISIAHLIAGVMGVVSIICVMIAPIFMLIFYSIMDISFRISIKNNDFTMIAGYKATDLSLESLKQIKTLDYFTGGSAIICELLFFGVYK